MNNFWSDFQDLANTNSQLLHLQHAALQYMTMKKLFEYIREKCEIYQHSQASGRDPFLFAAGGSTGLWLRPFGPRLSSPPNFRTPKLKSWLRPWFIVSGDINL